MINRYEYCGFKCPVCGSIKLYNRRTYFDAAEDKEDLEKLLSGEYLTVECPHCHSIFYNYGFLYEDNKKEKSIFFNTPNGLKTVFLFKDFSAESCYTVDNYDDMRDCIFSIEHNLDWWVIKLAKAMIKKEFIASCVNKGFVDLELGKAFLFEEENENMFYIELKNDDFCSVAKIASDFYLSIKNRYYKKTLAFVKKHYYLDDAFVDKLLNEE